MIEIEKILLLVVAFVAYLYFEKELKEYRIEGTYAITRFGFLFILINPSKYFKREFLVEGYLTFVIQLITIFTGVYILTSVVK